MLQLNIGLLTLLVGTGALLPQAATAALLTIINTNDSGTGSLRQAILDAASGDTINFAGNVTGTIPLSSGQLLVTRSVAIVGPGNKVLTISGNNASRVFETKAGTVNISGLTLANGNLSIISFGGCISNGANLTITSCVLSNNRGVSAYGGAIQNFGVLTVRDSTICSNGVPSGSGGGLSNDGIAAFVNSTIFGNVGYLGAGFINGSSGTLIVTNCTIYGNIAGDRGGGICSFGPLTIRSSTVLNNSAGAASGKGGGGVWKSGTSSANIGNTIIAGNSSLTNEPDCSGTNFTSAGFNLVGETNGSTGWGSTGDQFGTIASPLDPLLGPFQDNGGPALTLSPLPGSPAIDQGKTAAGETDQRGHLRPFDFVGIPNATSGDGSDIGAVEVDSPQLSIQLTGSNVVLSWSTNAVDFRLQSVTNLMASTNWTAVGGTPSIAGNQYHLTNSAPAGSRFYRLIYP